jgi:MFS family permease
MVDKENGYSQLLHNRRFVFLWSSGSVGDAGYAVYSISVLWLSYQLSGSLLISGLVLFAEFGIYALSFIAGPFVDRVADLRTVLLIGYPLQGVTAAIIGWATISGHLTVPLLLLLVVAISFIWDFTWTASQSALPRVVTQDQLFRANGLTSALSGGNQIAGFAVGGVLILITGPGGGAFLMAALMGVSAVLSIPISAPAPKQAKDHPLFQDFTDGWKHLMGEPKRPLMQLAVFSALQAFFSGAPALIITLASSTLFANSSATYAILFTTFMAGGLVGGLLLGQANPRRHLTALLVGALLAEGGMIVLTLRLSPNLIESAVGWFVVGMFDIAFYTGYIAYLQAKTPDGMLGRTTSNMYLFRGTSRATGALLVGALAFIGVMSLGYMVAIVFIAVAVISPLVLPAVRHLEF